MAKKAYLKEPAFYGKFKCMGDLCPQNCCHGWCIDWECEDVERLKNSEHSEKLGKLIEASFKENENSPGSYLIDTNALGLCPFLENGLCSIQKELGEGYLSYACRKYPRKAWTSKNGIFRTCNTSCPQVINHLFDDENSMEMLTKAVGENEDMNFSYVFKSGLVSNPPASDHYAEITDFFINILSDRTRSLETSVVLGAVAAKVIDRYAKEGRSAEIPGLLKSLSGQVNDPEQIRKLENIKPNYDIKLGFGIKFVEDLGLTASKRVTIDNEQRIQEIKMNYTDWLKYGDVILANQYIAGENKFLKAFACKEHILRNIALNIFLECTIPFKDTNYSVYENYCFYAAQISAIKLVIAHICFFAEDTEEMDYSLRFYLPTAARTLCQNTVYLPNIVSLMQQFGCTSPAYLAYILK